MRHLRAHDPARRVARTSSCTAARRAIGLRAVHAARGARGLDPRGRRRRARARHARLGAPRLGPLAARAPARAAPGRGRAARARRRPRGCSRRWRSRSTRSRPPRAGRAAPRVASDVLARRAADVPRGPLRPRDPDERRHEGRARDRALQRQPALPHDRRRRAHARRAARDRAPVGDRGQHRHDRDRLGALLVPLRGRPRGRGGRRPRDRARGPSSRSSTRRIAPRTRSPTSTARCTPRSQPA